MFEELIPELQPFAQWLLDAAGAAGYQPRVTSTVRTHTAQAKLYRKFEQGLNAFPVARPGTSAHEYGYAFDMVTSPMSLLDSDVGPAWEALGGLWGGSAATRGHAYDPVHFEYPGFVPPPEQAIPEEGLRQFAIDTAIGFVPVYGTVTTVASLLALFPGLNQYEAIQMLASPTHYYNTVRRLLQSYGYS